MGFCREIHVCWSKLNMKVKSSHTSDSPLPPTASHGGLRLLLPLLMEGCCIPASTVRRMPQHQVASTKYQVPFAATAAVASASPRSPFTGPSAFSARAAIWEPSAVAAAVSSVVARHSRLACQVAREVSEIAASGSQQLPVASCYLPVTSCQLVAGGE